MLLHMPLKHVVEIQTLGFRRDDVATLTPRWTLSATITMSASQNTDSHLVQNIA